MRSAPVLTTSTDDAPWTGVRGPADRWHVLRTRSRQEKALAEDLRALGVRFFLPMTRLVRSYGRRKVDSPLPLFPGYLFLSGCRDDCFAADRTRRVAQILEVQDQDRLHEQLTEIAKVLRVRDVLHPCPPLAKGMEVEVVAGPFQGVRGRVDSEVRDNRLVLNVDALGNAAVLEIDRDLLVPCADN